MTEVNNIKVITGKAYFAKVLGKPVPNYSKDGFEWTVDVALDKDTVKELKSLGLGPKIKEGNEAHDGLSYITFRRAAKKKAGPKAGEDNQPIRVVSPDGKTVWDPQSLIGNGSEIAVKFSINENKSPTGKKFVRADILSMQVRKHVKYDRPEQQDFDAVEGATEGTQAEAW